MTQYKVTYSDEHLAHSGILGQKWGIRRFQNEDGTYTAEGKLRKRGYREISQDEARKRELMKKRPEELSNKELQELNNRLNLERNYSMNVSSGKSFVGSVGNKIFDKTAEKIAVAVVAAGSAYVASHWSNIVGKL